MAALNDTEEIRQWAAFCANPVEVIMWEATIGAFGIEPRGADTFREFGLFLERALDFKLRGRKDAAFAEECDKRAIDAFNLLDSKPLYYALRQLAKDATPSSQ